MTHFEDWPQAYKLVDLNRIQSEDSSLHLLTDRYAVPRSLFESLDEEQRWEARALALVTGEGNAVLSGKSAARALGLPTRHDDTIELTLAGSTRPKARTSWPPGVLYRHSHLPDFHYSIKNGVRVTTYARTIHDLVRQHGELDGLIALDGYRRLFPNAHHRTLLDDIGTGASGVKRLRDVVGLSIPGVENLWETWARFLVVRHHVAHVVSGPFEVDGQRVSLLLDGHIALRVGPLAREEAGALNKRFNVLNVHEADMKDVVNGAPRFLQMVKEVRRRGMYCGTRRGAIVGGG